MELEDLGDHLETMGSNISKRTGNATWGVSRHDKSESPTSRTSCSRYGLLPQIIDRIMPKDFLPAVKGESWKIEWPLSPAIASTISIVLFGEWLMQLLKALFNEDQSEMSV